MKTPPIIEALFQIDHRQAAIDVCSAWQSIEDRAACFDRYYPHGMSSEGAMMLKVVAATLLIAALWGVGKVVAQLIPLRSDAGAPEPTFAEKRETARKVGMWIGIEARNSMWEAWKMLMAAFFFILLIQIVLA